MEAMREAWTDARMDNLDDRVADMGRRMDEGFNRVHEDLRSMREETRTEFRAVRGELCAEIAALHRLILQVGGGIIATIIASTIAAQI
jgi:hypothetical protein